MWELLRTPQKLEVLEHIHDLLEWFFTWFLQQRFWSWQWLRDGAWFARHKFRPPWSREPPRPSYPPPCSHTPNMRYKYFTPEKCNTIRDGKSTLSTQIDNVLEDRKGGFLVVKHPYNFMRGARKVKGPLHKWVDTTLTNKKWSPPNEHKRPLENGMRFAINNISTRKHLLPSVGSNNIRNVLRGHTAHPNRRVNQNR